MSSGVRWLLFGLLGLLVAGAVAFLAVGTVSEKIGISSESPTAGRTLAPARTQSPTPRPGGKDPGPAGTGASKDDGSRTSPTPSEPPDRAQSEPGDGDGDDD